MPQCVERTGFSFGYSTPEMILISVDLPEPFSPTRQCTSPTSSVRSTSRSACTPPKRFEMPDISRKVAKGSSCDETVLSSNLTKNPSSNRLAPRRIPDWKSQECGLKEAAWAGMFLKPRGDQPVDGFLVDPHDLVDLDLLAGDIDRRLAKAGDLDAIRDRLAVEHEFGDRDHRVTCIGWIPQEAFADDVVRDQRFRLARQHGALYGDLLGEALLTHRIAGADRPVRAEAENAAQVRIGLDHVQRRALAGVDLVGAGETVGDELHLREILLLIGNRGVGPLVVKRRRQRPDINYIVAFTTEVLGEALHLHFPESNGVDQFHVPVTTFLLRTFMGDDLDAGRLGALEHRLANLDVERHQADHVDLLGNQVFKQLDLLRRIDVRWANHGGIDVEILRAFQDPFFNGVEPGNARDLHDRDHLLLSLREGEARQTGTGHRCRTTNQFECLASVHCSLPGNYFAAAPLIRHMPGGSSRLHS